MARSGVRIFNTTSPEETTQVAFDLAEEFLKDLPLDRTLLFFGDLASGKTTFIKGLATGLEVPASQVTSPTFVYLNIYEGLCPIYHFDLWRLNSLEEFLALGFEEFLFAPGLKCLEWSERLGKIELENVIKISFTNLDANKRQITLEGI